MAIQKITRLQRMLPKTKLMNRTLRSFTTSSQVYANHYDVLGITPKATQGDIKSAYYKLSKVYHPDKSKDEASAKKFRAITEAYEVLGNINLKKMYDKGLLVGKESTSRMHYEPEPEPTDPTLKFYKSHATRHVTPTMDGRTPIYDFDAWSKLHYGNLVQRTKYERELIKKMREKQADRVKSGNQEALMYSIIAIGGLFIALVLRGTTDYDNDTVVSKKPKVGESN